MYIFKLDDIVNQYNNTYQSTIKMKPVDEKSNTILNLDLELVILLEYQNIKIFLQKAVLEIGLNKFL